MHSHIILNDHDKIGAGRYREVFRHPTNPDYIVKTHKPFETKKRPRWRLRKW